MKTLLTTLHSKFIHPSLALPYLAAYCGDTCGTIDICEFTVHEPRENILAHIVAHNADVVAFSVYLWNITTTLELVDALHCIDPRLRLVLGGPEAGFAADDIFTRHPGISAIICGEGEQPLRTLLQRWLNNEDVGAIAGVRVRNGERIDNGGPAMPLPHLDVIPSPFRNGLVDCNRGFVYYESSRGCPYNCAFCMSALDSRVRSFSMERIESDLLWLMNNNVAKIKLVDRTFNYNAERARHIFAFILRHNKCSHFHFEIGAHLLDKKTLELLRQVPAEMFQFEIGVQSTLPETLRRIRRHAPQQILEDNITFLRRHTAVHLHLDLIAGLPGEDFDQMLSAIDRVMALNPHHLQIEVVKLLPGAPLRRDAAAEGIVYDPNPPYRALRTATMSFTDLERISTISRLLDLTWNCDRATNFITALGRNYTSIATALAALERYWRANNLHRFPLAQHEIFTHLAQFVRTSTADNKEQLLEILARDYALKERLNQHKAGTLFDTDLSDTQQRRIKQQVQQRLDAIKGQGIKLQYFVARFNHLKPQPSLHIFIYLTASGSKMRVEEIVLPATP